MAAEERTSSEMGRGVGSRIGQQAREGAHQVGESAGRMAERTEEGMENLKHRFEETRDNVVDKTKEAARVTNTYVNENPWVAVGISAGVGFLLGMLLSPRNRMYS